MGTIGTTARNNVLQNYKIASSGHPVIQQMFLFHFYCTVLAFIDNFACNNDT